MAQNKLHLSIISQEKVLETVDVDALTAPTVEGEITILPGHIPLFARLQPGELTYQESQSKENFVVSKGFIDVAPENQVTVIVDTAVAAREISLEKAEAAMKAAHETMTQSADRKELLLAEASLKKALLEIKVAQRTRRSLS